MAQLRHPVDHRVAPNCPIPKPPADHNQFLQAVRLTPPGYTMDRGVVGS